MSPGDHVVMKKVLLITETRALHRGAALTAVIQHILNQFTASTGWQLSSAFAVMYAVYVIVHRPGERAYNVASWFIDCHTANRSVPQLPRERYSYSY